MAGIVGLALWVFTARFASFAFGIADQDEAFYLLHGGLWLQGAPPYTAVWDVKPPGLLLIFAAIRLVATPGVLAARIATGLAVLAGLLAACAEHPPGPPPIIGSFGDFTPARAHYLACQRCGSFRAVGDHHGTQRRVHQLLRHSHNLHAVYAVHRCNHGNQRGDHPGYRR